MIEISDQNQKLQVKFTAKSLNNNISWSQKDGICCVSVIHVLYTVIWLSIQLASACGYCLSNSKFNKVLNLFDKYVA